MVTDHAVTLVINVSARAASSMILSSRFLKSLTFVEKLSIKASREKVVQ